MTKFEPRVSIVTLGVADMPTSRKFYEDLGWKAAQVSNENVTFFQGRGIVLGLYGHDALAKDAAMAADPAPKFRGASLAYNCKSEQEVDNAFTYALSCGASSVKDPEKVFWGGYSGYFADPDGHLWEVAHNPFAGFAEDGSLIVDAKSD